MKIKHIVGPLLWVSLIGTGLVGCGTASTSPASTDSQGQSNTSGHRNFQKGASNEFTWTLTANPSSPKAGQSFTVKVSLQAKNGQTIPDGDLEAVIMPMPAQMGNGNRTSSGNYSGGYGGGAYGNHTGGGGGGWGSGSSGSNNTTGGQGRPRGFGGPSFTLKHQSDGTYVGTLTAPKTAGQYMIRVGMNNSNPRNGIRHMFQIQVQ